MAKRFVEVFTSDLSGETGARTVTVPGFELELTDTEARELTTFLDKWRSLPGCRKLPVLGHALKAARVPTVPTTGLYTERPGGNLTIAARKQQGREMREWLRDHGYDVSVRGRVPDGWIEAFRSKTPAPGWSRTAPPAATKRQVVAAQRELRTALTSQAGGVDKEAAQKAVKATKAAPTKQTTKAAPRVAEKAAEGSNVTDIKTRTRGAAKKTVPPVEGLKQARR